MSLDKGILHNKEHRKPYYGSKAIDKTCRNHGGCDWCLENRMYRSNKLDEAAAAALKEYDQGEEDESEEFLSETL